MLNAPGAPPRDQPARPERARTALRPLLCVSFGSKPGVDQFDVGFEPATILHRHGVAADAHDPAPAASAEGTFDPHAALTSPAKDAHTRYEKWMNEDREAVSQVDTDLR